MSPDMELAARIARGLPAPPGLQDPDGTLQRTINVLYIHSSGHPPVLSGNVLCSHGGHVFQCAVVCAENAVDAIGSLARDSDSTDILLLDLSMPDWQGLDLFLDIRTRMPALPVVVIASCEDEPLAIEALSHGAADYILKENWDDRILARSLRHARERSALVEELFRQKRNLSASESTARKMVKQLREEIDKRKQTEKLKDDFINTASHELRSPLAVIKGAVDNLKDGVLGELTDPQKKYVDISSRYIERMCTIINNLLDVAKLESGKANMRRDRIDAAGLVRQAAEDLQIPARDRGILLTHDIPDDLPPVYADADMVHQVLTNLLSNAMKFAKKRILVRAREVDPQVNGDAGQETLLQELTGVQITVMDDGPGIKADGVKHLFNKFVQLHRPSQLFGHHSTGLGLAICKEIVELHQGKIWVESKHGRIVHGAQFHFVLPRYDEDSPVNALIARSLADAVQDRMPLSLLILSVQNMEELRRGFSEPALEEIWKKVQEDIGSKVLRKGDVIEFYRGKSAFVLLVQSGTEGASSVRRRVPDRLAAMFSTAPAPQFNVGVSIYPQDGDTKQTLLTHAFENMEPLTPFPR